MTSRTSVSGAQLKYLQNKMQKILENIQKAAAKIEEEKYFEKVLNKVNNSIMSNSNSIGLIMYFIMFTNINIINYVVTLENMYDYEFVFSKYIVYEHFIYIYYEYLFTNNIKFIPEKTFYSRGVLESHGFFFGWQTS